MAMNEVLCKVIFKGYTEYFGYRVVKKSQYNFDLEARTKNMYFQKEKIKQSVKTTWFISSSYSSPVSCNLFFCETMTGFKTNIFVLHSRT